MDRKSPSLGLDTSHLVTERISGEIETFVSVQDFRRKNFERRWYDNNFFDDGYHFRFVSRTTGKIIDVSAGRNTLGPNRSIPKASRQIRAIANLLLGVEPFPVIYPQKINPNKYPVEQDPSTGQAKPGREYEIAKLVAKQAAQNIGHWVVKEWEKQQIEEKLTLALILAAKHGVSYIQIWPDAVEECIRTQVWDAFDVYVEGTLNNIEESSMVVKCIPKLVSQIKANDIFDKEQLTKINPDNRYATSEIKEAYMRSRYGKGAPNDAAATLILKEAFIKEFVNVDNRERIIQDLGEDAQEFKMGDQIIRHVYEAAGIWLYDKYTTLRKYPLVPFTFEPGPLYQVPLIERFIPANKSLDTVMSRVERYLNTMVAGAWLQRKGENFQITNKAGGNVYEWENSKPEQVPIAPLPQAVWNYIRELNDNIEEQGASVSTLNQIPEGVRSGVAIETLKANEYANLKIPSKQFKKLIKELTERMIDIAARNFILPQTVEQLNKNNEPSYFQIIGEAGIKARQKAKMDIEPNLTVIYPNTIVDIQIESGLGFTEQGRRDTMIQISEYMLKLAKEGLVTTQAVQIAVQELLETFSFGSTQEFMQAIQNGSLPQDFTPDQLQKLKIALLEVMKDTGVAGQENEAKMVNTTKIGVLEALKESGLADKMGGQIQDNPETAPINYKDAPEDIKRQMEAQAGFIPSRGVSPAGSKQIAEVVSATKAPEAKMTEAKMNMEKEKMMMKHDMENKKMMMDKTNTTTE